MKGTVWQATIYSFIRFPRDNAGESIAVEVKFEFPSYGVGSPSNVWSLDMNVLEKLVTITRGLNADRTVCNSSVLGMPMVNGYVALAWTKIFLQISYYG